MAALVKDDEPVLVMGDFNENPTSPLLKKITDFQNESLVGLSNPFEALYRQYFFSTFHGKKGLLYDQILFSRAWSSCFGKIRSGVFKCVEMTDGGRGYRGRPFRTYAGTRYLGGYSDHFPVWVDFGFLNNKIE